MYYSLPDHQLKSCAFKERTRSDAGFGENPADAARNRPLLNAPAKRRSNSPSLIIFVNVQFVKVAVGFKRGKTDDFGIRFSHENDQSLKSFMPNIQVRRIGRPSCDLFG